MSGMGERWLQRLIQTHASLCSGVLCALAVISERDDYERGAAPGRLRQRCIVSLPVVVRAQNKQCLSSCWGLGTCSAWLLCPRPSNRKPSESLSEFRDRYCQAKHSLGNAAEAQAGNIRAYRLGVRELYEGAQNARTASAGTHNEVNDSQGSADTVAAQSNARTHHLCIAEEQGCVAVCMK